MKKIQMQPFQPQDVDPPADFICIHINTTSPNLTLSQVIPRKLQHLNGIKVASHKLLELSLLRIAPSIDLVLKVAKAFYHLGRHACHCMEVIVTMQKPNTRIIHLNRKDHDFVLVQHDGVSAHWVGHGNRDGVVIIVEGIFLLARSPNDLEMVAVEMD